jgi:hypothetical protein
VTSLLGYKCKYIVLRDLFNVLCLSALVAEFTGFEHSCFKFDGPSVSCLSAPVFECTCFIVHFLKTICFTSALVIHYEYNVKDVLCASKVILFLNIFFIMEHQTHLGAATYCHNTVISITHIQCH